MYDPISPLNGAKLSELTGDNPEYDHLDAWLAHLHGYEHIQFGPYTSTHGMKKDGWSAMHRTQVRRVAVLNYTRDWNHLMQLLIEAHTRLLAEGCIMDIIDNIEPGDRVLLRDCGRFALEGPDLLNRWQANWYYPADDEDEPNTVLVSQVHVEPAIAIAMAIIVALEGQHTALAMPNVSLKGIF